MLESLLTEWVTEYETTRLVRVRSQPVAIASCILFVLIWSTFLGSIRLDVQKIYKSSCSVKGSVLPKLKGIADTRHLSDKQLDVDNPDEYRKLWDSSELLRPVEGGEGAMGSFTIVTNLIITGRQSLGLCPDEGETNTSKCKMDEECLKGNWSSAWDGVYTGKCVNETGTCEIDGWCPGRSRKLPLNESRALFEDVGKFTLYLKNSVEFPDCGDELHGSNLPQRVNSSDIRNCRYSDNFHCPIFTIEEIVRRSGYNFSEVSIKGGVFRLRISWKCDFDRGKTAEDCSPTYSFHRVDDMDYVLAKEYNFWSVRPISKMERSVRKMHGLKILIEVEGEGRKSDFFVVIMTLGSIMGFFSVKPLICDYIVDLCNFLSKKRKWMRRDVHEYCDRYGDENKDEYARKLTPSPPPYATCSRNTNPQPHRDNVAYIED